MSDGKNFVCVKRLNIVRSDNDDLKSFAQRVGNFKHETV